MQICIQIQAETGVQKSSPSDEEYLMENNAGQLRPFLLYLAVSIKHIFLIYSAILLKLIDRNI